MGKSVMIVTDECNEEVLLMAAAASGLTRSFGSSRLSLESFPPQISFNKEDAHRLKECADWASAVVAIERPGPNCNGEYKTMRGKSMDHLVAPLEDIIGYRMNLPGNIISEMDELDASEMQLDNAASLESDGSILNINHSFLSIGIGDGGNEVGMGKVYDKIIGSDKIPLSNEIACVVATTYLLTCSVSNWGGYAIAAALCAKHIHSHVASQTTLAPTKKPSVLIRELTAKFIVSEDVETKICTSMVEAGARDGVSGEMEVSVDGMSWDTSLRVLKDLVTLCISDSMKWDSTARQ